jgi:hypothetical protein
MRFLVFDGELINVGSIQEINFEEPAASVIGTAESGDSSGNLSADAFGQLPAADGRAPKRKPFAGPTSCLPDRARILVLGRSEPLETSDPQRIARLRELWRARRAVGA